MDAKLPTSVDAPVALDTGNFSLVIFYNLHSDLFPPTTTLFIKDKEIINDCSSTGETPSVDELCEQLTI